MIKTIKYCFENRKVASFYCNPCDSITHYTGYVEKYNDSEIIIAHISSTGNYDGYILRRIEDIYRIDFDGLYENKINTLYTKKKQFHYPINNYAEKDALLYLLLDYAKDKKCFISVQFDDNNYITGLISEYRDDILKLKCINDNGQFDGFSIVNVDDILSLEVDTDYEQDLNLLAHSTD